MQDLSTTACPPPFAGNLSRVETGQWTGWYQWAGTDPFEDRTGPFFVRRDADGVVCGFLPAAHNCNGHGSVHGGALMTFADFSMFMIGSSDGSEVHGVTVTMNCEFIAPAQAGTLLLARGELVRGGRSLLFVRGTLTSDGEAVLAFSGTLKRLRS